MKTASLGDSSPLSDEPLRIVLVDDHLIVREGLKNLINMQNDMRVVGEAADGTDVVALVESVKPDVVVLDLSMPETSGTRATEQLIGSAPSVKILILTAHEERDYVTHLFQAGASGYLLKRAAPTELVRAIRAVASGEKYVDPALGSTLVKAYLDASTQAEVQQDPLSDRERDVLIRIARGFSNKEIGAELGLSVKTVETYKARAAEKLGLGTRVEIVRYAAAHGWLEASPGAPE